MKKMQNILITTALFIYLRTDSYTRAYEMCRNQMSVCITKSGILKMICLKHKTKLRYNMISVTSHPFEFINVFYN